MRLRRDSELVELIRGYGLLSWQVAAEDVWHPLLIARVELAFDRTKAILMVHPTSAVPEIASEILSGAPPEQMDEFRRLEQDFRKAPIVPGMWRMRGRSSRRPYTASGLVGGW